MNKHQCRELFENIHFHLVHSPDKSDKGAELVGMYENLDEVGKGLVDEFFESMTGYSFSELQNSVK